MTRLPRAAAKSKAPFLAPSTAAVIVLPTNPAVAPISQHFQKGRGGSSQLRVVDRYVYVPKQKNSFPDCERAAFKGGRRRFETRECSMTSLNPPAAPPRAPHNVVGSCRKCEVYVRTWSKLEKRIPVRARIGARFDRMCLIPETRPDPWDRDTKAASTGRDAAPAKAPVRKKVACLDGDGIRFPCLVCSSPAAVMTILMVNGQA
jgi:hypothetical protein